MLALLGPLLLLGSMCDLHLTRNLLTALCWIPYSLDPYPLGWLTP